MIVYIVYDDNTDRYYAQYNGKTWFPNKQKFLEFNEGDQFFTDFKGKRQLIESLRLKYRIFKTMRKNKFKLKLR